MDAELLNLLSRNCKCVRVCVCVCVRVCLLAVNSFVYNREIKHEWIFDRTPLL